MEYRAWGPSRRWPGDGAQPPFPAIRIPDAVAAALDAAPDAPPFRGSASKYFDDFFSRLFHGWSSKLLSPDDARATASWIAAWAATAEEPVAIAARHAAERLTAAAEHGWYLDWD